MQAQSLPQAYALSFCAQERLAGGTVRNMCFFRLLWIHFECVDRCDSVSMSVRDSIIQDELSQEHQAEVTRSGTLVDVIADCVHAFRCHCCHWKCQSSDHWLVRSLICGIVHPRWMKRRKNLLLEVFGL